MDNELRRLRLAHNLASQAIVDVVKRRYPKYDKPLQSKCEASDVYGVELCKDAKKDVFMEFAPDEWGKNRRDHDGKRKNRLYCRLDDETYLAFEQKRKADGYATRQDCLTTLIKAYISANRKE